MIFVLYLALLFTGLWIRGELIVFATFISNAKPDNTFSGANIVLLGITSGLWAWFFYYYY